MKILTTKLLFLFFFSAILCYLIWPRQENLFIDGFLNPDNKTIGVSFVSPEFRSHLQTAGLPLVVKTESYDLSISNVNKKYDISYVLSFGEKDPILPYLENVIGPAVSEPSIDGHPSFEIRPGRNYPIKNIPINIPILDKYGFSASCGSRGYSHCPEGLTEFRTLSAGGLRIVASPNISKKSVFIQLFFVVIFWVVIINNISEFFRRKIPAETLHYG